jgi:hypothetical protein
MEPWTGAQRAFVVKAFYKNGDSFVIAQRKFRRESGIHRNQGRPLGGASGAFAPGADFEGALKRRSPIAHTLTPSTIA